MISFVASGLRIFIRNVGKPNPASAQRSLHSLVYVHHKLRVGQLICVLSLARCSWLAGIVLARLWYSAVGDVDSVGFMKEASHRFSN